MLTERPMRTLGPSCSNFETELVHNGVAHPHSFRSILVVKQAQAFDELGRRQPPIRVGFNVTTLLHPAQHPHNLVVERERTLSTRVIMSRCSWGFP
jgi:hypothetical protein